ncbi:MAG: DUF945 family protein [Granulosicoccus sp.]|nr:DUF945 family protein [Granulosicoccus sp.]
MNKKFLFALPLLAGASWAGAAYYTGTQTQGAYDQMLAQFNRIDRFTLVNEIYSAGLLNSSAVTRVMDSAEPDASVLFRLRHAINHSPIAVDEGNVRMNVATIETTLLREGSLPESVSELMMNFSQAEPFQINTSVGFDGTTSNEISVSSYEQQIDGVAVRFKGLDYTAIIDGDSIVGSGRIGELVIHSDAGTVRLMPGDMTTDLRRSSEFAYTGSYGIEFDKLTFTSADNMLLDMALQSIGFQSDTQIANELLQSQARFWIGNIDTLLPLNSVSVDTRVFNIPVSGLSQYVDAIRQLSRPVDQHSPDTAVIDAAVAANSPIIGPGTGLNYTMKLSNDGGDATLAYEMSVIDRSAANYPAGGLASLSTLRDLLNVVQLEAHLDADAVAVDMTPLAMLMSTPEALQVVIADGASYRVDLNLADLILTINGNPLSLEELIGDSIDTPLVDVIGLQRL